MSNKHGIPAPTIFELPKVMRVGELYQTAQGRGRFNKLYDMRILAVIHVDAEGRAIRLEEVSTCIHDVEDRRTRTIVVWELQHAHMEAWEPRSALREHFIIRMRDEEQPLRYETPDVEKMIFATFYGGEGGKRPDVICLTSEAYKEAVAQVPEGRGTTKLEYDGGLSLYRGTTQLEYEGIRLLEVPGVPGIKVWGGYAIQ